MSTPTRRRCGVLCHPTSLPGPFGIGELGAAARQLIDFLAAAGQTIWQILPLGPTGYGDSPYQPFSAFAGNPLLIDLGALRDEGLLSDADLADAPGANPDAIDYGAVITFVDRALRRARERFRAASAEMQAQFAAYCVEQAAWLDDYCLFMALKRRFRWASWVDWDRDIALRQPSAVVRWQRELADEVDQQRFLQFLFDRQWRALKAYAEERGIRIIGDVPIFVGHDSADVWSHRELFRLDQAGRPTIIAGVPPDYFSPTGQRWGNPLYRWDVLAESGYRWWLDRLGAVLSRVDLVRLDHFRGFAGYWEVPAEEETAVNGRWVRGPGADFFRAVRDEFGELPIIAEDLGLISADVIALRKSLGLPGMRVLQFAFGSDANNPHLPFNYEPDTVAYTATHDNDTTVGWYAAADELERHRVRVYTGSDGREIHWAMIRLVLHSTAETAIIPLQDLLSLGSEARLNQPGRPAGNWTWRYRAEALTGHLADTLRELALLTGRWSEPDVEAEDDAPIEIDYEEPDPR